VTNFPNIVRQKGQQVQRSSVSDNNASSLVVVSGRRQLGGVVENDSQMLQQLCDVGDDRDGSDVTVRGPIDVGQLYARQGGVNAGRKTSSCVVIVVVVRRTVEGRGKPVQDVQATQDAVQPVLVVVLDAGQLGVERTRLVTLFFPPQQTYDDGDVRQLRGQIGHRRRQLHSTQPNQHHRLIVLSVNSHRSVDDRTQHDAPAQN